MAHFRTKPWTTFIAANLCLQVMPANAQVSAPPMVSVLPDVRSISRANAAGVIEYCVRRRLMSSSAADHVLASAKSRASLVGTPDYIAGAAGHIITHGKDFAIGRASSHLQSQSCAMVLRQAQQWK
jgi:hypothetical protein